MNRFDTRVGRVRVHGEDDSISLWVYATAEDCDIVPASLWWVLPHTVSFFPPKSDAVNSLHNLPRPSDTLLSLLRTFQKHRAAYAVVDRLIEEYPELEPYLAGVTTNATESGSEGVAAVS